MSVRRAQLRELFGGLRSSWGISLLGMFALLALSSSTNAASIRARVDFPQHDLRVAETASGTRVELAGAVQVGGEEHPELPMVVRSFYVPEGFVVSDVRATPLDEVTVGRDVRLHRREAALEPTMEDVARAYPAAVLQAEASDVFPARLASSLSGGMMAGYQIHSVAMFPVRQAASGDLMMARSLDLELTLSPGNVESDLVRNRRTVASEQAYLEAVSAVVMNRDDIPVAENLARAIPNSGGFVVTDLPSVEGTAVDMVIVTTAALETSFQPLADWKTKKGIPTVIRTVEWIDTNYPQGHDQPERVRLFLRDAYEKWGTFMALVGGDHGDVTPRHAFNRFFFGGALIPTDQYFACLEGDWNGDGDDKFGEGIFQVEAGDSADLLPEIFLGRAPVSTPAEAANFVSKSFTYDRTPPTGYVEDVCVMAEVLFPDDWVFGDPIEQVTLDGKELTDRFLPFLPVSWSRTELYQTANTQDRNLALAELSAGHHMLLIMNHGDAFKFSVGNGLNPFVFAADADSITNGDRLHVVIATACNPNQFDLESCGESFINNPAGGGIVTIGPTRVDFPLSATEYHEEMFRIMFEEGITRFGAMTQVNRVSFVGQSATDATPDRWTMLSKILLGDPELRLWTAEPGALTVSHAAGVTLGSATIAVSVADSATASPVAGALVCVQDGVGTYSRVLTDASGIAIVPLNSSQTGTLDVTVTAEDYRPAESSASIDPIASARIALDSSSIDDDGAGSSSGNGDGVIDAGETIELGITAINGGGALGTAASVMASVEAGTSATFDFTYDGVGDPARVFVGPNEVNPGALPFTLDFASPSIDYIGTPPITWSADSTSGDQGIYLWQDDLGWHVWWSSGLKSVAVTGTITTDGRVRDTHALELEASDTVTVSAGADSLTFSATTGPSDFVDRIDLAMADNTMLTVTSAVAALGDIGPSATGSGTVVVDVSASARAGQIAYVDLDFTTSGGGPWSNVVPVVFAGPELDAYVFAIDDSNSPPVSGNGNGVAEVGETVRITPTVLNSGSGSAEVVSGSMTAASGITFVDSGDSYGSIAPLGQDSGTDGYVFTIDDGTGTTVDLDLSDSLGRTWSKNIDFIAPLAPDSLDFSSTTTDIAVVWVPNAETDLAGYNVYRSATSGSGFTRQNFELLRAGSRFVDADLSLGAVFYYQVTAVDSSGNESPASAEIFAYTTQAQVAGWPQDASNNVFASMAMGDTDGNGTSELWVGSKDFNQYSWDFDGDVRAGFPISTNAEIWSTTALADIDEDGDLEAFWGSMDSRLYAVHHDGTPLYGGTPWVVDLSGAGSLLRSAITVADLDFDYELEILFGTDTGGLHILKADGTSFTADSTGLFAQLTPSGAGSRIWGSIAVADLENDGSREIIFSSWNDSTYVYDVGGTVRAGFPRGAFDGGADNDFRTGPSIGDIDNDGTMEILVGNNNGILYVFNHDGTGYLNADGSFVTLPDDIRGIPALANMDADPELEIVIGCGDSNLYAFNHDGTGFNDPDPLVPFADLPPPTAAVPGITASPIIVDVDGDSDMEVFVGHRNSLFYGFHHDGSGVVGMPIPTSLEILSTAAAGDIDSDGDVDVAFASFDGSVNVLDFTGASTPAAYEWPTYAGNNFRTSTYGQIAPYFTGVGPVVGAGTFRLDQNHPNPFSRGTSIRYAIPVESRVSLQVFDVSGRLVRTLFNGVAPAGQNTTAWDGRDNAGRNVAAGIYFYRLDSVEGTLTKKGLLLR